MYYRILKFLLPCSLFIFPKVILAQYQFTVTPSIYLSGQYDDNVFLDDTDEVEDYLTMVSPGISLDIASNANSFTISYSPTFVWYYYGTSEDTIRHLASLAAGFNLTERLRFDLTNSYIQSEDPIEVSEDVDFPRDSRATYYRNTLDTSLGYQFGPENSFLLGYTHSLLVNEDPTVDDREILNPYANFTYWFNVKNGIEIDYSYRYVDYTRNDSINSPDNYSISNPAISYFRRFSPRTTFSVNYVYTESFYDDDIENYRIHDVYLGLAHSFSNTLLLDINYGYAMRNNEETENDIISIYRVSLEKLFNRGSFIIGAESSYRDDFWEVYSQGLVRYWRAETTFDYQLLENTSFYAGASYTYDEGEDDWNRGVTSARTGLTQTFLRWFTAGLSYSYTMSDDDIVGAGYKVNRVMLTLGASRPYRL
ncbi:hypothetical protein ACFL1Z_08995 [Thermodesulfobacteriota bacterium]